MKPPELVVKEEAFIHKTGYLNNTYRHLYPIKYPEETLEMIRKLALIDELKVVNADYIANYCQEENENSFSEINWKIHIVYDVPEN